jgi:hypothetical protein
MPEIQHTFTAGKMNKDLDERLLPNGQYRDALNIQVASSDGDDVGAVQNILGNTLAYRTEVSIAGAKCIGGIADTENEKIYWFIYGNTVDAIAEFDQVSGDVTPVLVDKQNILKFSRLNQYRITAVNIIDGLLFFTDNNSEPKVINIDKFKAGSTDFNTHTQLNDLGGNAYNFTEEDITVIKKGPSVQPTITMANTKRVTSSGATGITTSTATYDFSDGSGNLRSVGYLIDFTFNNFPTYIPGDILIFRAGDDANGFDDEYEVRVEVQNGYPQGSTYRCRIMSIGENTPTEETTWEVTLKQDDPLFEKEFVRFGYRYKYKDGEYSTFSPFSDVAFLPQEFKYDPAQGYNLGMVNDLRYLKISDFIPSDIPKQVEEVDIIFKKENNNNIYVVKSIKYNDPEWSGTGSYELETEMIYKTIESNQLLRPFDSVPLKAQCQELVANRIVYGNYTQNFDLKTARGAEISPKFSVTNGVRSAFVAGEPLKSLKTQRTYQLGVVYRDEYGRQTPVQADDSGAITLAKDDAVNSNQFSVALTSEAPSFATSYQFFIKETANEYYNLAMDRWYDAEDGNVWLSFASSERNKVDEETFLILKKKHDSDEFVTEKAKYKVIAIESSAPQELKETKTSYGTLPTTFSADGFPIPDGTELDIDKDDFESRWGQNSEILSASGLSIRIKSSEGISQYYDVASVSLNVNASGSGDDEYRFLIKEKFREDVKQFFPTGNFNSGVAGMELEIARTEVKSKAEFTGRFFVKVYRDALLQSKILETGNEGSYSVKTSKGIYKRTGACNSSRLGDIWKRGPEYRFWINNCTEFEELKGKAKGSKPQLFAKHPFVNVDSNGNVSGASPQNNLPDPFAGGIVAGRDFIAIMFQTQRKLTNVGNTDGGIHVDFCKALTTQGTKFRFTEDPDGTVYKIKHHARIGVRFFDKPFESDDDWARNKGLFMVAELDKPIQGWDFNSNVANSTFGNMEILQEYSDDNTFSTENPAIWETEPKEAIDIDIYYEASQAYPIADHNNVKTLDYFNCFSFGNGVESNRIRDDFNTMTIAKGVKASAPLAEQYKQEVRKNGLIFSGIYNSTSGINRLNQFIIAEPITKDINPVYGSIQKIHQRDTDLTVCCEDKILKVLANKDALFEASGNPQLTATNRVLGQAVHYVGDFGISKNPESFANYGFRSYFTDRARGVVLRLSRDGLTPISQHGMVDYFRDNLATFDTLTGSYDDNKGLYNITMTSSSNRGGEDTVSFKEQVTGWPSRKSFIPEFALSLNNIYYSFKDGQMYSHTSPIRNTFYSASYRYNSSSTTNFEGSRLKLILNDSPNTIKSFKTISYEGSQSRVVIDATDTDGLLYNLTAKAGWHIDSIVSDKQSGFIPEFIEKEGKWFNYIKGDATTELNLDTKEFNVQGIGLASTIDDTQAPIQVTITINENND